MDTNLIFLGIMKIFQGFIHSPFFLALKLMLAVYVTVLFADIIMLLILRGFGDVRVSIRGANVPLVFPKRMRKKWNKIEARLENRDPSQYKIAVLEADGIVDKIFQSMELKGSNMTEKLDKIAPGQMEEVEEIKDAHKIRNQIVNDPSFQLDKKKAKSLTEWFNGRENIDLLKRMEELGVQIVVSNQLQTKSYKFNGKTFVLTGELESFTRDEAKDIIRKQGGDVSSSVSKKTDYILAGENPGSKYKKAKDLGVKIIDEEEFIKLIK